MTRPTPPRANASSPAVAPVEAGRTLPAMASALHQASRITRTGFAAADAPDALAKLAQMLAPLDDLELVILFVSPQADIHALSAAATRDLAPARVIGCTTAGEIGEAGYTDGEIVAIGLPRSHFCARVLPIDDLNAYDAQSQIDQIIRNRNDMARETPQWGSEFAFLLVDGLSVKEDALTADLAPGLGPVPLFGGSAGDSTDFGATYVLCDGGARQNAAVLLQIRSNCPIKVFNTDHLVPTAQRMVVTGADPARRLVYEINAEPAAREYARLLGKDPEQLTTFTFAAHPLVVRIGGQHHVRAIQQVADTGDLVFFSAIDEGVVLTLAEPLDMVDHLDRALSSLGETRTPDVILACDCLLRRMEAQQKQLTPQISALLAKHRAVGFCTYGEQVNSIHVNQTLTGVAIYPPETDDAAVRS
ncbi:FIST N-terminal domain-containing protein [Phaeobacter inhibens]|uniref:FIST N-terminal domain-containing protein n=1 Tax=Phaeobacter inhibens TaxID=221822 RepID=UPI0021A40465|nr:FIST N-terminal domain-containing protein [Phaeobacter inhibens]UWR59439.1 FIST C-terminal domain-containing protein [Phaeobacter inhibens]UWS02800.1 FIST C-terminal domain-containing protein [Phaeobacter inhibens]